MAQIYDHHTEELHLLLDKAANQGGSTLVIPDLQRPYVWTPNQVSLLVDSLIRGWPFGTLLLWKVAHNEKRNIPSRAFWEIIDKTGGDAGHVLHQRQAPANYQMVLDGQQRVQSLLLATHGDNWGFKLSDKAWGVEAGTKSAKGKNNSNHWTLGSLCLDLEKFLGGYRVANDQISAVEFDKVLIWAVTDEADGKSKSGTKGDYKRPLPDRFDPQNKSNLIRFGRLWDLAGTNQNFKEKNYSEGIAKLLTDHGVSVGDQEKLQTPLAELMTTLRDVKLQKVAFLELRAFDAATMDRDAYDDAIVNIFTRLNTAGRTLTREEITFAWLKVGWLSEKTSKRSAQKCFKDLKDELKSQGLELGTDDLVSMVSFIWAVVHNEGKLLNNRDLLQGDIIRPMAATLSAEWQLLAETVESVARIVKERDLVGGRVFGSINALAVLCAANFQFMRRGSAMVNGELAKDSLSKTSSELMNRYMDRWLAGSSWAQRWARSSGNALPKYAGEMAGDTLGYTNATGVDACKVIHEKRLETLIADVQADAISHINNRLGVETREQVRQYFGPLWIWHRLGEARWKASSVPLRIGKSRVELEVDHLVSVKIWNSRKLPEDLLSEDENLNSVVNSLGNCALLQKSFNIIKSADPLRTFINKVHEFKNSIFEVDPWAADLSITINQLDGDTADLKQVVKDVQERDAQIRADLVKFIRGEVPRADIDAAS